MFRKKHILDIRRHYRNIDSNTFIPTKQGVCLQASQVSELVKMLSNIDIETPAETLLGEMQTNANGKLRAVAKEFNGRRFIDLRVYFKPRNATEDKYFPTRKGISINYALISDINAVLKEWVEKYVREGESIQQG
jgi:hypothetical protein